MGHQNVLCLPIMMNKIYIKSLLKEIFLMPAMAGVIYLGIHAIFQQHIIEQTSMVPTLTQGQRIFINKLMNKLERGDIIVFKNPDNLEGTPLIKQVIGLPGEEIEIKSGFVYIDGSPLVENYLSEMSRYTMPNSIVPEGEYFVLGDNRNLSRDSHTGWTVPQDNILGKACLSIWPLDRLGLVPDYAYSSK
jgi:signal peptidase I